MDWLRDFQQSFREPVFGFLSSYWPYFLPPVAIGLGWWFSDGYRRRRSTSGGDGSGSGDDSGDSGGDDGGGDGGGD